MFDPVRTLAGNKMLPVEIKIINPSILMYGVPTTETSGSAGYDLRACIEESVTVFPDTMVKIPTGIAIHIKNKHYAGMLMPRSGLADKFQITLQNAVGLIDSDYQGELCVLIRNEGYEPYKINIGDRIAQLVFVPVIHPVLVVVQEFTPTDRGGSGFGSTGIVSRNLTASAEYEEASQPGRELPTQSLGNDELITIGTHIKNVIMYEATGQELLEVEYGD